MNDVWQHKNVPAAFLASEIKWVYSNMHTSAASVFFLATPMENGYQCELMNIS
jgi:hypothetical protein